MTAVCDSHSLTADSENLISSHQTCGLKTCGRQSCVDTGVLFFIGVVGTQQWLKDLRLLTCAMGVRWRQRRTWLLNVNANRDKTYRMAAVGRYLQEQARDATRRAQHTTRRETVDWSPGTWWMYLRRRVSSMVEWFSARNDGTSWYRL